MKDIRLVAAVVFAAVLAFPAHHVNAQVEDQEQVRGERQVMPELAMVYTLRAEPAMAAEFDRAIAEHARWRSQQGDPWSWDVYQVVAGEELGTYIARAPVEAWSDFDQYDEDFNMRAAEHFNTTVGPYLKSSSGTITRIRTDAMQLPDDLETVQVLSLTVFQVEPERMEEFEQMLSRHHQANGAMQQAPNYVVDVPVAGATGEIYFVTLHERWADLERAEPALALRMANGNGIPAVRGLREELMEQFDAKAHMILQLRPDLSVRR